MRPLPCALFGLLSLVLNTSAQILFDFDSAPAHISAPFDQTADGITAHFSSSSALYNYSIQPADTLGFTPAGFSGNCIYPNTIYASDLLISFDQPLTAASLLYAPEEYATDSSCTMRITGYAGTTFVGTNTKTIDPPGTWPSGTLTLNAVQPFDHLVIHYDQAPVTGGDYGPIFMADNLIVTPVPEPADAAAVMALVVLLFGGLKRCLQESRTKLVR